MTDQKKDVHFFCCNKIHRFVADKRKYDEPFTSFRQYPAPDGRVPENRSNFAPSTRCFA
jgi:hypothetical protein